MKLFKIVCIMLAAVMLFSLCACGADKQPEENTPVSESPLQSTESGPETAADSVDEEEPESPDDSPKAVAAEFVDKDVSELFAAIGMPESSEYAPSCLGEGEDGVHYYDGFAVYTYKEGESEIITVVK